MILAGIYLFWAVFGPKLLENALSGAFSGIEWAAYVALTLVTIALTAHAAVALIGYMMMRSRIRKWVKSHG